jgi:hypothetical protein
LWFCSSEWSRQPSFDYSGAEEKWQALHMHWFFSLKCHHQKNPYSLPFIVEVLEKVAKHKVYFFWIIFHATTIFTLFQRITNATKIIVEMTFVVTNDKLKKNVFFLSYIYVYINNNLVKLHYLNVLINLCD